MAVHVLMTLTVARLALMTWMDEVLLETEACEPEAKGSGASEGAVFAVFVAAWRGMFRRTSDCRERQCGIYNELSIMHTLLARDYERSI